ncbi:hypothetical protein V6N11_079221 [Hibiscus sabdariffa]|uniref:Disease resistance protein n=1 Tax=Hibiscus sabdariffa TaxID=183260 RepID=A0ABR2RV07_9ROSI
MSVAKLQKDIASKIGVEFSEGQPLPEYLNLGDCYNLKEIPHGLLSRLSCLQDLILGETPVSGKEVGGLKKLKVLEGRFEGWDNLNMYLQTFNGREEPRTIHYASRETLRDCKLDGSEEYPLFSREFSLGNLLELRSICSVHGVVICDSLKCMSVVDCPKFKRMALNLPHFNNVPASAPSHLSLSIRIRPKEWWESVEWDAKSLLEPFMREL